MSWRGQWQRQRSSPSGGQRAIPAAALRWIGHYVHGVYARVGVLLSAGLVLALVAMWGLSVLTEEVLEGDTIRFDRAALLWLNERATPWLDDAAIEVTALGDTLVVIMVTVISVSFLWLLGRRAHAAFMALAVTGGGIITPALKMVFDRPRPQVLQLEAHYAESSAAYPSGHATMSMVTLVAVAFIIQRLSTRRWVGTVAMALAGIVILLVGVSRMYLGVHFPSDVLAGFVVGFVWTVFCALTVEAMMASNDGEGVSPESEPKARSLTEES